MRHPVDTPFLVSRRGLLAGLAGQALALSLLPAARALAEAPPRPRPVRPDLGPEDLVAQAALGGAVSYLVVDRASGRVIESRMPDLSLPPASVAKTATVLYALSGLGPRYRFCTRLIATGPVSGGRLRGDLVLAGGGDPALDTDALAGMVAVLRAAGITGVDGAFRVWGGALPHIDRIATSQPEHLGYNAAVSGLNLNFNRVNFGWRRGPQGMETRMEATGEQFSAPVRSTRMRVVDRDDPLFTYTPSPGREVWTVAGRRLPDSGSRWLPVRQPEIYAGEAFRALAQQARIDLPAPQLVPALPQGEVVAERFGDELSPLLRDMLKHSNNLMAEVSGLTATAARGLPADTLGASAAAMTDWARARYGLTASRFGDHSGLGEATRTTTSDLVRLLVPEGPLPELMKPFSLVRGDKAASGPVVAKTGTLNFVSSLAGYVRRPNGRTLCFAILTADVARRDRIPYADREAPPGAQEWDARSRGLQRALLDRWSRLNA